MSLVAPWFLDHHNFRGLTVQTQLEKLRACAFHGGGRAIIDHILEGSKATFSAPALTESANSESSAEPPQPKKVPAFLDWTSHSFLQRQPLILARVSFMWLEVFARILRLILLSMRNCKVHVINSFSSIKYATGMHFLPPANQGFQHPVSLPSCLWKLQPQLPSCHPNYVVL